jgi:hypothetical protein
MLNVCEMIHCYCLSILANYKFLRRQRVYHAGRERWELGAKKAFSIGKVARSDEAIKRASTNCPAPSV